MASRVYSPEQLLRLRESPLVQKPDGLPSIEQWMEGSKPHGQDPPAQRRKPQIAREDNGHDHILAKIAGAGRRRGPEGDIVLGPPKMTFTSNNRNQNRGEQSDKRINAAFADDTSSKDRADFHDAFFRSRTSDTAPIREKRNGFGDRKPRESEGGRWDRLEDPDRDRDRDRDSHRRTRDSDSHELPLRRNGVGRGRADGNWLRSENHDDDGPRSDFRNLSWRDRDRDGNRDRDRENDKGRRDWNRPSRFDAQEEEPEWMNDEPALQEEKQARTQEDFHRWKEQQKQKSAAPVDKDDFVEIQASKPAPVTTKSTSVLPTLGNAFGAFESNVPEERVESPARPAINKKASRFETLFRKGETPIEAFTPVAEPPPRPLSTDDINPTNEDQEGFQRILQMLGNKGLTPKPAEAAAPPPEPRISSSEAERQPERGQSERQRDSAGFIDDLLARQAQQKNAGQAPANHFSRDSEPLGMRQQHGMDFVRLMNGRPDAISGRHEGFPRPHNDSSSLAPMRNEQLDPNRAFLLNLMNPRMAESQLQNEHLDFAQLMGAGKSMPPQQTQTQPLNQRHAPSAPPGLDPHRRPMPEQDMPVSRRPAPPPGFFDHEPNIDNSVVPPGLTRRNTTEAGNPAVQLARPAPSQASNLGIPSMRMNEAMILRSGGHIGVDGRMIAGPPPGLMPGGGPQTPQGPPNSGPMGHGMNGHGAPIPNGGMRLSGPPMGPPGFPPQGMPMNMHGMPPGPPPGAPGHFAMGLPHPSHPNAFFPPPGMPPMGGQPGYFPPGGRGFLPPNFDGDLRGGGGRGF